MTTERNGFIRKCQNSFYGSTYHPCDKWPLWPARTGLVIVMLCSAREVGRRRHCGCPGEEGQLEQPSAGEQGELRRVPEAAVGTGPAEGQLMPGSRQTLPAANGQSLLNHSSGLQLLGPSSPASATLTRPLPSVTHKHGGKRRLRARGRAPPTPTSWALLLPPWKARALPSSSALRCEASEILCLHFKKPQHRCVSCQRGKVNTAVTRS